MMKVAVYTVAYNEAKHVQRWAETTKDADLRLVGDTGSTDYTPQKLRSLGVEVIKNLKVRPWRFDMARNTVLSLLPEDIDWCICLDMDEVLQPGWRAAFDDAGTRKRGLYVWQRASGADQGHPGLQGASKQPNEGQPEISFLDDRRFHRRFGYAWRYPCHEELFSYGGAVDDLVDTPITITHLPDPTKSRAQYFDILRYAAIEECPHSARMQFYYGRELCYRGQYDEAVNYFKLAARQEGVENLRFLAQSGWLKMAQAQIPNGKVHV